MSFDVFVQAFANGAAGRADAAAVAAVLDPYVRTDDRGHTRLETADGGADLYGYDDLTRGFMVSHVAGVQAWDLIVEAARAAELVIMPVGCAVALTASESYSDLPAELRDDARVVRSGIELLELVESSP